MTVSISLHFFFLFIEYTVTFLLSRTFGHRLCYTVDNCIRCGNDGVPYESRGDSWPADCVLSSLHRPGQNGRMIYGSGDAGLEATGFKPR